MTATVHRLRRSSLTRPSRLRLSLLVDERDVLRVRRTLVVLAHPAVAILTLKRVRGDSRLIMTIDLDSATTGEIVDRLLKTVNCGALGTSVMVPTERDASDRTAVRSPAARG